MEISWSQIAHNLVGLVKYAVILVLMVLLVRFLPGFFTDACRVHPEDVGMRQALGKTALKVNFDRGAWTEEKINRGDLVVVSRFVNVDGGETHKYFAFRVVAVEGDHISAKDGWFMINGKKEEYRGITLICDRDTDVAPRLVPRGYVYVLADDRESAMGGNPGMLPCWRIVGKVPTP